MIKPILARRSLLAAALLLSVACMARAEAASTEQAIALLVPGQQTIFAQAADALRAGFFAAHRVDGEGVALQVIEIEDERELHAALKSARSRGVHVVVGPLQRAAVNAIVDGGDAGVPLVALNYPDRDAAAPATMVALGLSAEAEAQRMVRIALAQYAGAARSTAPRFMVLAGSSALERRIAAAFSAELRAAGEVPTIVEVAPAALERLGDMFERGRYEAVFLALAARDAAQLRARIPRAVLVFGTSLLNVGAMGEPLAIALAHDLDGVRFADMPWLLAPEHPAVMAYPAPPAGLPAELVRLYALGIDAYRVARVWITGQTRFEIDGVTGHLHVDRAQGPRVERTPMSAIFRNGSFEREDMAR
jgi:uncharacterized protein